MPTAREIRLTLASILFFSCGGASTRVDVARNLDVARITVTRDELVIPFYEGVRVPANHAPSLDIPYPGVLSVPMIAFGSGDDWTAIFAPLDALGTVLRVHEKNIELTCPRACTFRTEHASSWEALAHAVARAYDVHTETEPLARGYGPAHFYVRNWISESGAPIRTAWTKDALAARLDHEQFDVILHVYGIDPGGVDLAGEVFRERAAEDEVAAMVLSRPHRTFLSWLNLRTYKHAIPAMHVELPLTDEVRAMARLDADGVHDGIHEIAQYSFRAWEMCLGSPAWQESRMRELARLIGLGFKVIALDEFPVPVTWDTRGCQAKNHLHRPGDFADEARVVREFIAHVWAYAKLHGVLLTEEEPSAAYLPFVSGYVDRLANPPSMYEIWTKVDGATVVPLFSTMFGDIVTPYTDPSPTKPVPRGWITTTKIESP